MDKKIIQVKNLKKNFKVVVKKNFIKDILFPTFKLVNVVNDISISIDKGESVAFLGPNGAGKTTTIKMLSGIVYPSSGEISVLGFKPTDRKQDFFMQIGLVMGSKSGLNWDLTARQSFEIIKEIYKIDKPVYEERLKKMVDMLGLEKFLDIQVRKLSLGERMKLELVGSLLHMPKILFLDEPTVGLDVVAKEKIRKFLREIQRELGVTILLTSHDMDDIELVCDRVIVINKGKKIYDGSLQELTNKYNSVKYVKTYFESMQLPNLDQFGEYSIVESGENYILFKVDSKKLSNLIGFVQEKSDIVDLDIISTPLEEIIKDLFEK